MFKSLILATLAALTVFTVYHLNNQKQAEVEFLEKHDEVKELFNQWKLAHGKAYGASQEQERFTIFKANHQNIEKQNSLKGRSFSLEHNKFSDLTNEEFVDMYTGGKKSVDNMNEQFIIGHESQAESLDWRIKGAVSPVKDQGQCGSCWAFSAIGALEGLYAIQNGKIQQFSEQALVDCSGSFGNQGCNGGWMDQAFSYIKANGIPDESAYKYTAANGQCKNFSSIFKDTGFTDVPAGSYSQMLAAINIQPLSVAINAAGYQFQSYSKGILDYDCSADLDHGVLLVGYGSDNGKNYWIVKNSWGSSWGEQGFFRLRRDTVDGPGMCGIHQAASYPNNAKEL